MTLAIDAIPITDSPLGRLDPRWKLAALAPAALAFAAFRTPLGAGAAFGVAIVLAVLARLPPRWFLTRLGTVLLVVAPFAILLPFLQPEQATDWEVGSIRVSQAGSLLALTLSLKALSVVTLVMIVLATSPLPATLKSAQALRVPGLLVQLLVLTLRYVFLLAAELHRLRIALRVRGYRNRANLHSYRTVGQAAGTLLVRSCERAERVSQAMACRGFDGRFRSLASFRTTAADVTAFLLMIAVTLALLIGDRSGWSLFG